MPMAQNLLKAGQKLTVFDINTAAVESLQKMGAAVADKPSQIAENHSLIVTMLPAG